MNVSNDPGVNLLAIGIATSSLFLFKGLLVHQLYKKWPKDILEMSCYFNIVLISLAKFYTLKQTEKDQTIVMYSASRQKSKFFELSYLGVKNV